MLCADARVEMAAYLAEDLAPEVRFQLDVHLAACAPCRAELEALRETWGALGALPAPSPSPDLETRVLARATGRVLRSRWLHVLRPLRVPVAALLAVLLSVGLSTLLPYAAAARLCREALEGFSLPGSFSDAASPFLVGTLYASLPVLITGLLAARLNARRPLVEGGVMAAVFVVALGPYALAVCWQDPAAFVGSLLAGLTAGAFASGPGSFWLGRRGGLVAASA